MKILKGGGNNLDREKKRKRTIFFNLPFDNWSTNPLRLVLEINNR